MVKVDLHCHLDGSLEIDSVEEMLKEQDVEYSREELERRLRVSPNCTSLTEYLEKFDLPLSCLQTSAGLKRAAYELVKTVSEEDVRYIEVRFAPMLSVNRNLDCRAVIESVVEGLKEAGRKYDVYASAIVCAMRHHSEEMNLEMLKTAREFLRTGVCALDLAGDESAYPTKMFRKLFERAKAWDVPFTIHSGECGSLENVREAVELGAKRLGHGIALEQSLELQKICREKRIGIEMCPTSNLQTKAVDSFENYPLETFIKNGLYVSINTDNRTVSGTTMTKEIELVMKTLHQSEDVVKRCMENAIVTSFASDDIKHKILTR